MFTANKLFIANKVFITNEINDIKSDNELIKKFIELKIEKLSKSKKILILEHALIFLKLAFTNIQIQIKIAYFLEK